MTPRLATRKFHREEPCPTCKVGLVEISGRIYPPEPGVGIPCPQVEFDDDAVRLGEHEGDCEPTIPAESVCDLDALAEDVAAGYGRRW